MYNDPDCKPWTSSSWAPDGYVDRYDFVQARRAAELQKSLAYGVDHVNIEKAPNGK